MTFMLTSFGWPAFGCAMIGSPLAERYRATASRARSMSIRVPQLSAMMSTPSSAMTTAARSGSTAERLPGDLDSGAIDRPDVAGLAVAIEHDGGPAERVRDQAVGSRLDVPALDGEHPLRMRQIPGFAAVALLEPGQHQLRAHGAVAD